MWKVLHAVVNGSEEETDQTGLEIVELGIAEKLSLCNLEDMLYDFIEWLCLLSLIRLKLVVAAGLEKLTFTNWNVLLNNNKSL